MLDSHSATFTRSDEGYFGCGYAASFHRVGNVLVNILASSPAVRGICLLTASRMRGIVAFSSGPITRACSTATELLIRGDFRGRVTLGTGARRSFDLRSRQREVVDPVYVLNAPWAGPGFTLRSLRVTSGILGSVLKPPPRLSGWFMGLCTTPSFR